VPEGPQPDFRPWWYPTTGGDSIYDLSIQTHIDLTTINETIQNSGPSAQCCTNVTTAIAALAPELTAIARAVSNFVVEFPPSNESDCCAAIVAAINQVETVIAMLDRDLGVDNDALVAELRAIADRLGQVIDLLDKTRSAIENLSPPSTLVHEMVRSLNTRGLIDSQTAQLVLSSA